MNKNIQKLPADFQDLQHWVSAWSEISENGRRAQRDASTYEEIKAFYDALLPRADAALTYLNTKDMNSFDGPDEALFALTLSLAEITAPVEWYEQVRVIDGIAPDRYAVDTEMRQRIASEKWEETWT